MKLDDLIQKLIAIDFKKDSIYLAEKIVKEISTLEPKNNIFINKVLDTIESQNGEIFSRMMLTCVLRNLPMRSTQIERIWKMINDTKQYNSGFREYLMESLSGIVLQEHHYIAQQLYDKFKSDLDIKEKIQAAKILLYVDTLHGEISSWLFNFAVNDNLPSEINGINITSIKLDCCDALSSHKNCIKSGKKAVFHLFIQCNFLKCYNNREWEIIEDHFLKMVLDDEDIQTILKLVKDCNLISYHRIHFLHLLEKVSSEMDIVTALIDILLMNNETFNDFNINVVDVISKLTIAPKHIKYIEVLKKSNIVSSIKNQLETVTHKVATAPTTNSTLGDRR